MGLVRGFVALGAAGGLAACIWALGPVRNFYDEVGPRPIVSLRDGPQGQGIWGVWTGHSYAYGIETGGHGVALVDTGSDPSAAALAGQLAARQLSPADVHTIVLTHGHDEVTGGLAQFPQAVIWVGAEDRMLARRDVLPKALWAKMQAKSLRTRRLPKRPMQTMWPGQTVHLGPGMDARLVALPGHTWGSFVLVTQSIAFVGDSLCGGAEAPARFGRGLSVSPKHNGWALRRLLAETFSRVATSHTGSMPLNPAALRAWLDSQSDAEDRPMERTYGGSGALDSTATTAGKG